MREPSVCLALFFATFMLAPAAAASPGAVPGTGGVLETEHHIDMRVTETGASLVVTRKFFNPSLLSAQVELPIELPCTATLDQVRIEESDGEGGLRWREAEIVDDDTGWLRWSSWLDGPPEGVEPAFDSDTAVLLTRSGHCDARLSLYPVPPVHERTVSYRVFVPSSYVEGQHHIELPRFDGSGLPASVDVRGLEPLASSYDITVDDDAPNPDGVTLDSSLEHVITLRRRDAGLARVHAVDLDLDALFAEAPAAAAKLDPEVDAQLGAQGHLLASGFDVPRELVALPPIRRVIVLLDASRSLASHERAELQKIGADYLARLEADMGQGVHAEIMLFDRHVRPLYHAFMPAAWVAEDLRHLDIDDGNGSELGLALDAARQAFTTPTTASGVDWIVVLSDLELRRDLSVEAEREAAQRSPARMHLVRSIANNRTLSPAAADDEWTAVAREAGGMLWDWGIGGWESDALAAELVRPRRLWSARLELLFADGERREVERHAWLAAGQRQQWLATEQAAALVHAAWVGDVWGQRRAWLATPDADEGRRLAGALATFDEDRALSDAVRTALAMHADVVSPFSSAWATAGFDGPAPAPMAGFGIGGFGSSYGHSIGCGGARSGHAARSPNALTFAQLVQTVVDACPQAVDGAFAFETTDLEIVAVESVDACIGEQLWALDILPTHSRGRVRVVVEHSGGRLVAVHDRQV